MIKPFIRPALIVAAAMLAVMCTSAPKELPDAFRGTWSGNIEKFGLTLTLHLDDTCTVDSPDQGAYGLKAELKSATEESVKVKFPEFHASLSAQMQGDSLIGTFSQMGIKSPIRMGRGEVVRNRPQTPFPPFPYETQEVTFNNGPISFSGTLSLPESREVAVVLVSGSGKQDRDENIMEHRPFAVIADALAREGISSLRYDDRECGGSGGVFAEATTADFATDAAAAMAFLRELGYKKVGIIGHSEGGTIAFMLAGPEKATGNEPDFIVSLAGMADRGDSTLVRQTAKMLTLQGAPEKLSNFAAKLMTKQSRNSRETWMEYFCSLDPAAYIMRIECPVLALNGDKDTQVIPKYNLSKVQTLCPSADCRLYPDLNHLFQHCTTGLSTEYAAIEETFSEEAIADIIEWIKQRQ